MSALPPPPAHNHEFEDSGAHDMTSSDSEHFSDASEGRNPRAGGHSHTVSEASNSPVPITRVERVDDEPRHGEVPNTDAYQKRSADAVPDEVEIIPDGQRSRASSRLRPDDRPQTPGGSPVPKMVVEKIDPDTPAYGDVPGTEAYEKRKMDALPDEIIKSPAEGRTTNPWNVSSRSQVDITTAEQTQSKNDWEESGETNNNEEQDGADEGFGDDFDDFAEGEEAADDDFGDFDDGFAALADGNPASTPSIPQPLPAVSTPNLHGLSHDQIQDTIKPHIDSLFSAAASDLPDDSRFQPQSTPFLTERSLALWSQLVAPPPIQPPNWTRSHIRRLFLVSIGVPLDLDEILPRSTQKKLILPSFDRAGGRSPRQSTDSHRPTGAADRLRMQHTNGSDSSVASTASAAAAKEDRRRKRETLRGPPPPPVWDAREATLLAGRTEEALTGMSDDELRTHVDALFESERVGRDCLRYWEGRVEEAGREKEAFEGVIENLVKHARSVRK